MSGQVSKRGSKMTENLSVFVPRNMSFFIANFHTCIVLSAHSQRHNFVLRFLSLFFILSQFIIRILSWICLRIMRNACMRFYGNIMTLRTSKKKKRKRERVGNRVACGSIAWPRAIALPQFEAYRLDMGQASTYNDCPVLRQLTKGNFIS